MGSRIKYEDVKFAVETEGWTLVSTEYKNLDSDLIVQCPGLDQHEIHTTYKEWRKIEHGNHVCPICEKQTVIKKNEKPIKKDGYRILGIDQSSTVSGWAIFDGEKLINYGHWEAKGERSTGRIASVKAWLAYMIDQHKPDEVILEDIQLQKFDGGEAVLTYKKLAHLQGVLKNYLYENGIPYKIVPVATWRNYSEIKGKNRTERKKSAQIKVKNFYEVNATQDEADAILIARWAAAEHKANDIIMF